MPTGVYIRKPFTKEARENIGKAKMGNKNPMFGKPTWNKGLTKETDERVKKYAPLCGIANKGKRRSPATEFKKGLIPWSKGTKGVLKCWSKGKKCPQFSGKNNPRWKGGITPLYDKIRRLPEYKEWRTAIYERDNYTCQECGSQESGALNAHHIKPFSELFAEFLQEYNQFSPYEDKDTLVRLAMNWQPFWTAEGITYCKDCHIEEHKVNNGNT